MKTKTIALLAAVGGVALVIQRSRAQAAAAAAMEASAAAAAAAAYPPNSGPVVNGLSFYQLEGLSGFSLKKAFKSVTNTVQKVTDNKVLRPVIAVATAGTSEMTRAAVNMATDPSKELKRIIPVKKVGPQAASDPTPATSDTVYQDINGMTITRAQYDAINMAIGTGQPIATTGGWALPAGYISATNPTAAAAPVALPMPIPSINQGTAPVNYSSSPNDDLTVTSSQDSDYGTQFTADSSGSPGLPGGITASMSTPSAQEAAPVAPEAPKSNTGAAIIGTALAAGAAYLAFR